MKINPLATLIAFSFICVAGALGCSSDEAAVVEATPDVIAEQVAQEQKYAKDRTAAYKKQR